MNDIKSEIDRISRLMEKACDSQESVREREIQHLKESDWDANSIEMVRNGLNWIFAEPAIEMRAWSIQELLKRSGEV
jgi:hypothetical protein